MSSEQKGTVFLLLLGIILIPTALAMSLQGKKALVTGSSGGIGAAIAKALASQGARVMVHYHTRQQGAQATKKCIQDEGGICDGIVRSDFRSPLAIDKMMSTVDRVWGGKFDILINNAGIVTKLAMEDDDDSLSSWHETMAVNLHAPVQLSKLAQSRMKKNRGGVIVNVSSIHGERSVEYMVAYATSKAALDSVTRGLALEYAQDNIRVLGIAPGVVPVERTAAGFADQKTVDMWLPHLPRGRLGSVEDIAEATVHLCTSDWATGSTLTIDGGMLARSNMPNRPRPPSSDESVVLPVSDDVELET